MFCALIERGSLIRHRKASRYAGPCPYQKRRPTVLVVQATEDGHRNDPPDPADRSMDWGIFVERQVSPELVVIREVGSDDAPEISLPEPHEMVGTPPRRRPDHPLDVSV